MGEDSNPKPLTEIKRSQRLRKTINQLVAKKNSIQATSSGTFVISPKRPKGATQRKAQAIASVISQHGSQMHTTASNVKAKLGHQSFSTNHTRKLAGKLVKKTLNASQIGSSAALLKRRKNNIAAEFQKRNCRGRRVASHASENVESLQKEVKKRQRRKQKNKVEESQQDDIARIKRRVKYLLKRIKLEQNLIDAYSAEGWKGQSREKLRPERELQRARNQILHFQLGIREAIKQLDLLGDDGSVEDSKIDPQGQIYHEDIFCAKCKLQHAAKDNDIILCDGFCNRAFHQLCLEPPLRTEEIPPEDEGWLCAVCECKSECLDIVNAYLDTCFDVGDQWQKIFAEAAALASGAVVAPMEESLSEDSEDDDYDPDLDEPRRDGGRDGFGGLDEPPSTSSDVGEDSDSEADTEEMAVLLRDELLSLTEGKAEVADGYAQEQCPDKRTFEEATVLIEGKRQRTEVDYKKLHDEMFGKNTTADEPSEDDEWGPRRHAKKLKEDQLNLKKAERDHKVEQSNGDCSKANASMENGERRIRLPQSAVERLRVLFKENPLPSKARKESISKQLDLPFRKVNFWFRNARYAALKKGLGQHSKSRIRHAASLNGEVKNPSKERTLENHSLSSWILALDRLAEAQWKVARLQKILKALPETLVDECAAQVMYVAVAELREKLHP